MFAVKSLVEESDPCLAVRAVKLEYTEPGVSVPLILVPNALGVAVVIVEIVAERAAGRLGMLMAINSSDDSSVESLSLLSVLIEPGSPPIPSDIAASSASPFSAAE